MTLERMIRRGTFPILTERPLDEMDVTEAPTAKVYVVEVGAYSNRFIDAVFATRELAEQWVERRQRRAFERNGRKAHRKATGWRTPVDVIGGEWTITYPDPWKENGVPRITVDGKDYEAVATGYEDVPAETFEAFLRRTDDFNEYGDVEEYDLWDVLPLVPSEGSDDPK